MKDDTMKLQTNQMARAFIAGGILLLLSVGAQAWRPNAQDSNAAIEAGDFGAHLAKLGQWLGEEVPASREQITKESVGALLQDPEFLGALIERRFITRVWGKSTLGDWAKAAPENREFLAWLISRPALMDVVLLARTPTAGFARLDDSWNIDTNALEDWKKIYLADPDSREGLYLRLAIACVLRPPGTGNHGAGEAKEQSSVFDRYMHYRKAHADGELLPSFDTLTVWEMTHVVSSSASNADLAWGREALNTWKPSFRQDESVVSMVSQVWNRSSQVPYHDMSCVAAGGGKCGPRSSFGVFINQAFGIPSIGVGQPAHAAVSWRNRDGEWQVGYGRGWNVSKIFDRYKMEGPDFVERTRERKTFTFALNEHLRWLAGALENPGGGYMPPADRQYANPRAAAVFALADFRSPIYGNIKDTPFAERRADGQSTLSVFRSPADQGDNYVARMRGFLYPPKSGDYVFGITGDDGVDLFLSKDEDPGNKALITSLTEPVEPTNFGHQSAPVRLEAGKRYYIEAVHVEGGGSDHMAVAWKGPGMDVDIIPGNYLSPYTPNGRKGSIIREVWQKQSAVPVPVKSDFKPEAPIEVAPGVIHVEAEDFYTQSNVTVENCYTGGKQVYYPALTAHAMCGYKVKVPKTGMYQFRARVAAVNWGQQMYVRSFGAMHPVKEAKTSNVFRNQVEVHGPQQAIDHDLTTRWAMDFGKEEGWLELDLGRPREISKLIIDERALNYVCRHTVEYKVGDEWKTLLEGDFLKDYVKSFPPVTAQYVRLSTFDSKAPTGGPTVRDFSVGEVLDGNGFLEIPWAPSSEQNEKGGMSGRWQTTMPLDMYLVEGEQTVWVCTQTLEAQRSVAMRWFELTPKNRDQAKTEP